MLEEGLAGYISRNFNIWKNISIFEPVHLELLFLKEKEGMPWLNLSNMEIYYYGKRKKSFIYIEYGLTSAHFLVEEYSLAHVLTLINSDNIKNASLAHLKKPWNEIIEDWKQAVISTN